MKTPPFLLGASLIFWGWQTGLWPLAAIMALVLEGSRLIKLRWNLSPSDFNRVSDLCTLVLVGMFVYLFVSNRSAMAILVLLQWLPLTLLPLLAAQVYSTRDSIEISALFLVFRRKSRKPRNNQPVGISLDFAYFGICILSASAANMRTPWFYVGLIVLSVWALWFARSRRFSPILWASLFVFVGFVGYFGQVGLHGLQTVLEKKTLGWFIEDADPYRASTAIGDVGSLKLSHRILFRIKPGPECDHPMLLREASYNVYRSSMWFASHADFKTVHPEPDGATWKLFPCQDVDKVIIVSASLEKGKSLLKLPIGASKIANLPVLKMVRNQFGAVKVEEGPGLMTYQVSFEPDASFDGPPNETDLNLPEKEMPAITEIVRELELRSKPPREVLKRVAAFFEDNFKYSLNLDKGGANLTPMANFLIRSRSGHCEYFASATVLLLRAAGIPARYATGYSVQEFSKLESRFVVRERHAHAWVLVHVEGAWRDFDTTPCSWSGIEQDAASVFQPLFDIWSWFAFKFSAWRWRERQEGLGRYIWLILIPLILLIARRLYSRDRLKRPRPEEEKDARVEIKSGADSEFYMVEKRLTDLGYARFPWEPLSNWIKRIEEVHSSSVSTETLHSILALHYRYRFDPNGITMPEKATLKSEVREWLEHQRDDK